jgi:hypothetical protein
VGRYPRQVDGGVTQPCVLMDSNPPSDGTPLHEFLTVKKPDNLRYIHQPGGLDPRADWLQYLPGGRTYYDNLIIGQSKDWVDVHVHSKFGRDVSGQSVFGQTFDEGGTSRTASSPFPGGPWWSASTPASTRRRWSCSRPRTAASRCCARPTRRTCCSSTFLTRRCCRCSNEPDLMHRPFMIVMDPAGRNRTGVSDDTRWAFADKRRSRCGWRRPTSTRPHLGGAVADHDLAGRQPAFRIDGRRCPVLADALARGYRYRRRRTGELEGTPEKRHPTSDVADALQYGCLGLAGRLEARPAVDAREHEPASALAWT